jgi:TonB-linked SusC/RagA family outer membrane protein
MRKITLLLALLLIFGLGTTIAQSVVTGLVSSAADGSAIPGATVRVKGLSGVGTVTDIDGKYSLKVPAGGEVLVFSFVGMKTMEVSINGQTVVDAVLQVESMNVDEVVITGYGVTKKVAFTGASQQVKSDVIKAQTDANPIKALQGKVAGFRMNVSSGQPGSAASVNIRGLGSINSGTQPLYVIDGIPISSDKMGMRTDEGQNISPLASLNSSDIESINILKDATATSIYGARAANGVVVITTKKGKEGKTKVNFDLKRGVSVIPQRNSDYKVVNREQFIELMGEGLINKGYAKDKAEALQILKDEGAVVDDVTNTDWFDEVTRNGKMEEYSLDLTGGNDKTKFFVSGSYLNNEGIIIGKDLKRYSARLNLDNVINKNISFGLTLNGSYTDVNNGAGGGYYSDPITQAYMQLPTLPVTNADGTWNMNTYNGYNPVAQRSYYGDKSNQQMYKVLASPYVKVNFLKDFTFVSRYGIDLLSLHEFGRWSMLQPQGKDMRMNGEQNVNTRYLWTFTNTVNYLKTISTDHHINVLVGQEAQRSHDDNDYLSAQNFPTDKVFTIANASKPTAASTKKKDYSLISYFANFEYDYLNKYYLSGSFRHDGSSRFGSNNKWADFYSVGAKYRISQEAFMQDLKWLNSWTIRSSYGTVGNQDIDWYAWRGLYSYGYNYASQPGATLSQILNPDLKWEQTAKFNVGTELTVFDKVTIEFDYYKHTTKDMIFAVPISYTTGLGTVLQNIGKMENKGIELLVNANILNLNGLKWDVNVNFTKNENKIVKLATADPIKGTTTIRQEGLPYYSFYLREYAGVNPANGKPLWYKADGTTTSVYNEAEQRVVGSADPKHYGGFGTNLSYKGFELNIQFSYVYGSKVYGSSLRYDEAVGNSGLAAVTEYVYNNRWTTPGQVTDVPQFIYGGNSGAHNHSSRFLMDGSYWRFKTLGLSYSLPKSVVSKLLLGNVKVYFNADNLYTHTAKGFRGLDPEVGTDGLLWWNYPVPRTFIFGINVGF